VSVFIQRKMDQLPSIIQPLHTSGGFLLVAHGQSGDLGNAPQGNYDVAHENIRGASSYFDSLTSAITSYINSKVLYLDIGASYESILYGGLREGVSQEVPVKRSVRYAVPRAGIFGSILDLFLGKEIETREVTEMQPVTRYEESATLEKYLQSGGNQPAHFIAHYLKLNEPLRDSGQRVCPAPILYVLGNQDIIRKTVDYLKNHPSQYTAFMRALIPTEKFPVTNKFILNQLQSPEHIFLNLDKITERIRDEDLASICERLGEKRNS